MNDQRNRISDTQNPIDNNYPSSQTSGIKSFSRLLIGTIGIGLEELSERLKKWEESSKESDHSNYSENNREHEVPGKEIQNLILHRESIKSDRFSENLQFALIGLLIDSQVRIEESSQRLQPIGDTLNRFTRPFFNAVGRFPLISPIRTGYSSLVEKGEDELNRLILLGRIEYERSHQIAETAIDDTFEEAVDYLSTNQEIQELIHSQGVGLAGEVMEEIRERTVSADNFIDGIIRPLLKRKPRSEIPPPQYLETNTKSVSN